jgi:hypothetical protein
MRLPISCATSTSVANRQCVRGAASRCSGRVRLAQSWQSWFWIAEHVMNARADDTSENLCGLVRRSARQSPCVVFNVVYRNVAGGVRIELMVARYLTYLPCREQACSQGFSALRTPRSELLQAQVPCHDLDREGLLTTWNGAMFPSRSSRSLSARFRRRRCL